MPRISPSTIRSTSPWNGPARAASVGLDSPGRVVYPARDSRWLAEHSHASGSFLLDGGYLRHRPGPGPIAGVDDGLRERQTDPQDRRGDRPGVDIRLGRAKDHPGRGGGRRRVRSARLPRPRRPDSQSRRSPRVRGRQNPQQTSGSRRQIAPKAELRRPLGQCVAVGVVAGNVDGCDRPIFRNAVRRLVASNCSRTPRSTRL